MVRDDINDGSNRGKDFKVTDEDSASDDRAGSDGDDGEGLPVTDVDTSHIDGDTELGPGTSIFDLGKPECPVCSKKCKSERGVKSHFGQVHKDKDFEDYVESGGEDGDDDEGADIVDVAVEFIESTPRRSDRDPRSCYDDVPDVRGVTVRLSGCMYSGHDDVVVAVESDVSRDDIRSVLDALPRKSQDAKISDVIVIIDDRPSELHDVPGAADEVMGVTPDGGVKTVETDGSEDAQTDGGAVLGASEEFDPADISTPDTGNGELSDRADEREQSMKTRDDLWDDARRAFEMASVNGTDATRRDALSVTLTALERETQWMSVRERSDQDYSDLWRWVDGEGWQDDGHEFVGTRLDSELDTDGDSATAKKAVYHLAMRNKVDQDTLNAAEYDATLVPVKNGAINIDAIEYDSESMTIDFSSVELEDLDPEHRFVYQIDTEWDPENADLDGLDEWVSRITLDSHGDRRVLWEMAGHSLHPRYPVDAFLVVLGKGGSGKSEWLSVVKEVIGDDDVTTLSISDIESGRFTAWHAVDARANINTELSGKKLETIDKLKTMSAGEEMYVEDKKKTGFFSDNDATMLFASDNPPAFPDDNRNDAVKRRLYPVEFPCQFVPDPDPGNPFELERRPKMEVEAELQADARVKAALMRAVEGLTRILAEGDVTSELSRPERLERYESFADPGRDFLRHCIENAGPESEIESGVMNTVLNEFADAKGHEGRSLQQVIGVFEKSSSISFSKHRSRSWSDEQSKHTVYSGIRFSAEALKEFVPDHAKEDGKLDLSAAHEAEEDDTEETAIQDHSDSADDDSEDDRDLRDVVKTVVDELDDDGAPIDDVIGEVMDRAGVDRDAVDDTVENLKAGGYLYEPRSGHWRTT